MKRSDQVREVFSKPFTDEEIAAARAWLASFSRSLKVTNPSAYLPGAHPYSRKKRAAQ